MTSYFEDDRNRLIGLLSNIQESNITEGWEKAGQIAIASFVGFGFSKKYPNLALMVTSSGRSLIDCSTSEKIARDYDEYKGLDASYLHCQGIAQAEDENILLATGSYGGGLPLTTSAGESISLVSPNWPQHDLIFCTASGHPLIEKHQDGCIRITTDYIEAVGFSWCGNYFAVASNSDFNIWKRIV